MQNVLAVFVTAWFFLYSVLPICPTQNGVQCPTAPVQKITVAIRNCCGKLVGLTSRAPKPGEKGFVQCRCAEKKGATEKAVVPNRTQPFLALVAAVPRSLPLPEPVVSYVYTERFLTLELPPLVLPPV